MIVLALDPSLRNTGVALIDTKEAPYSPEKLIHYETIKTENKEGGLRDDYVQIGNVFTRVRNIVKKYDPALIVAEIPYGSQSNKGAIGIGFCISLCACFKAVPITPQQVAKTIGYKKGDDKKKKAISFVARHFDKRANFWNVDEMNHVADAICSYFAYLNNQGIDINELRK